MLCKQYSEFTDRPASKGNERYWKAILFPDSEKQPRLIWLKWAGQGDGHSSYGGLDVYLPTIRHEQTIDKSTTMGRGIEHFVNYTYDDEFLINGSKSNLSLRSTMQGAISGDWRGTMVVYGQIGMGSYEKGADITMAEFRYFVDHFSGGEAANNKTEQIMSIAKDPFTPTTTAKDPAPLGRTWAVRIPSIGDSKTYSKPGLAPVLMPKRNPRNRMNAVTVPDVCQLLELPYVMIAEPVLEDYPKGKLEAAVNIDTAALGLDLEFLYAAPEKLKEALRVQSRYDFGTAIIACRDLKPLDVKHVEALIAWCRDKLCPLVACVQGHLTPGFPWKPILGHKNSCRVPAPDRADDRSC
jgi:hypothetical protein